MLIPPDAQNHLQKVRYHYERNSDTVEILTPVMERVSKDIDITEESGNKTEAKFGIEESATTLGLEGRSLIHSATHKPNSRSASSNAKRNINSGMSNYI